MVQAPFRPTGTAAGLTVSEIVDRALVHIETEGYETLTMRKLAAALEVTPMSIYRHVANKQALLSHVGDRYFAEFAEPRDTGDAAKYLEQWFLALHKLMLARPVLAHVMSEQALDGPVAWAAAERAMTVLVAQGTKPQEAGALFASLLSFTIGFTLLRRSRVSAAEHSPADRAGPMAVDFPLLAGMVRHESQWLSAAAFRRGLRALVRDVEVE